MEDLGPPVEFLPPREVLRIAKETMGAIDVDLAAPAEMAHLVGSAWSVKRQAGPWRDGDIPILPGQGRKRVLLADPGAAMSTTRYQLLWLRKMWLNGAVQQAIVWSRQHELLGAVPWIWDSPLMVCFPWRRLKPQWWDDELDELRAVNSATAGFILFFPPARPGGSLASIAKARAAFHGAAGLGGRVLEGSPPQTPWEACYESAIGRPYDFEPRLAP